MKDRRGYTLAEVVVAMTLTALMVGSMVSVALSGKRSGGKGDRRVVANQGARQLSSVLKSYVTADETTTIIAGPGTQAGSASWDMTSGSVQDDCGTGAWPTNCFALKTGSHTLKNFLPSWFEAAPYSAQAVYFVSYPLLYTVTNGTMPIVNITVTWSEP